MSTCPPPLRTASTWNWAKRIAESGVPYYIEVGNMPTTNDALAFLMGKHLVAPSKAVNAPATFPSPSSKWLRTLSISTGPLEVDAKMTIMKNIYSELAVEAAERYGLGYSLVAGQQHSWLPEGHQP